MQTGTGRVGVIDEELFNPDRYTRISDSIPSAGGGMVPQPTQGFGGMGMGGGNQDMLRQMITQMILQQPKRQAAWKSIYDIWSPTEADTKRQEEIQEKQAIKGEFDRILKEWEEIPPWARIMPFASRLSPQRADYEVARDRFNDLLITMVADARITDAERKFYLKSMPRLVESKQVARAKIDGLKKFMDVFAGAGPPTQQFTPSFRPL